MFIEKKKVSCEAINQIMEEEKQNKNNIRHISQRQYFEKK